MVGSGILGVDAPLTYLAQDEVDKAFVLVANTLRVS